MSQLRCPKCESLEATKSGVVGGRQRYKCRNCGYHYSVAKVGKETDPYYVVKALQLYLEGISYREIERVLGVSHVSVMNWVKKYGLKAPRQTDYHPSYQTLTGPELAEFFQQPANLQGSGLLVTELGDKYLLTTWKRLRPT